MNEDNKEKRYHAEIFVLCDAITAVTLGNAKSKPSEKVAEKTRMNVLNRLIRSDAVKECGPGSYELVPGARVVLSMLGLSPWVHEYMSRMYEARARREKELMMRLMREGRVEIE